MRKTIELYSDKHKRKIPISISYYANYEGDCLDDIDLEGPHSCEDCSIMAEEIESIVCRDEILIKEVIVKGN